MSALAAVVLAHRDPPHLGRLVRALAPAAVVLHVDAKVPAPLHAALVAAAGEGVVLAPRRRTDLASWSLVAAELDALEVALRVSGAGHVVVLSGSDYPLLSVPALEAELRRDPATRLSNAPLPFAGWSTARHPDGGLWRLDRRFLVHRDRLLHVAGVPLRWPVRRALPPGLALRGGSQWKVYARSDAEALLEGVRRHPELVRRWRTTLVPDETFVPTVLASRSGPGRALEPQPHPAWFMRWNPGDYHPRWLTADDLEPLARERAERERAGLPPLLFARKVSSREGEGFRRGVDVLRGVTTAPAGSDWS